MQEILVDVIERIYNGSMIKFEMESIITGWCKSDSGVRQFCLVKSSVYMVVNKDGVIEKKSQAVCR